MAWRSNKEAARAAYCALGGIAQQEARRDQIIHNARTNWELLRSENKCFITTSPPKTEADKDFALEISSTTLTHSGSTQTMDISALPDVVMTLQQPETEDSDCKINNSEIVAIATESISKPTQMKKLQRSATARKAPERRVNFSDRSASQDTDASHSTSTSSEVRLPPILLPIICSLENVKLADSSEPILKRWESISSADPIVDSSFSSLPSSSESEDERTKKLVRRVPTAFRRRENFGSVRSKSVCDPESRRAKSKNSEHIESMSNISTNTNMGSVSSSGSDQNNKVLRRDGSLNGRLSTRNIRSATVTRRSERASSASCNRASTARIKSGKSLASFKVSEPVPKPMPPSKDREQGNSTVSSNCFGCLIPQVFYSILYMIFSGVDYLVEVCDGVVSAWGAGAVRRLSRDWDWERARHVKKAAFHYVHFNAVAQSIPELKAKLVEPCFHVIIELRGLLKRTSF